MSCRFRLGIVGTGLIARNAHVPAALCSSEVELAALVDSVYERAEFLARDFGIRPRIATEVSAILAEIDGVVIATPNHTHHPLALECLKAGVPVLIEKPLATTVAEGESIVRAGEESGTVVAVGYSTRFLACVVLMRDLLANGYFGSPKRFAYQFGTRGGWSPLSAYNLDRTATGGGVLVVSGSHFLDRMIHWFGYPDEVALEDDSLGGPEANAVSTFRYEQGQRFEGTARFSKTVDLRSGFVMETTGGIVILREGPQSQILFRRSGEPDLETAVWRQGQPHGATAKSVFQLQLEDFVRACRQGGCPKVTARAGLESLRLIEDLYAHRRPMREDWYWATREVQT